MGKKRLDEGEQQHLQALAEANRVRVARAQLKRRIGEGELTAAEVILRRPWQAHSMSVSDLIMSQKRWGQSRCRRLLQPIGVPENARVGRLTERQRAALVEKLGAKGARPAQRPRQRALSPV